VTCGVYRPFKELQAGHAVGGRTNAVLFNEDLVHAQCYACNIMRNGNYERYALFMIDKCGRKKYEEFLGLRHKTIKISVAELEEIATKYKMMAEVHADLNGLQI